LIFILLPTRLVLKTGIEKDTFRQLVLIQLACGLLEIFLKFSPSQKLLEIMILGVPISRSPLLERVVKPEKREVTLRGILSTVDISLLQRFLVAVKQLLQEISTKICFEEFNCYAILGLPDPSYTGMLLGVCYMIEGILQSNLPDKQIDLSITPLWTTTKLEAFAKGILSIRLIEVILPLLRFFLNKSVRRFLASIRKV